MLRRESGHGRLNALELDRFDEVQRKTGFLRSLAVAGLAPAAESDERGGGAGRFRAEQSRKLVAAYSRQSQVEETQLRLQLTRYRQRLIGVMRDAHVVPAC